MTHKNIILKHVTPEQTRKIRESYGLKDDDIMILFLGRLVGVKGVDKLIMAMPHILPKFPKAKLVVVGVGDLAGVLAKPGQNYSNGQIR